MIEFEETITLVKESIGKAEIKVVRANGADGRVSVHYRTKDIDAIATKDYEGTCSKVDPSASLSLSVSLLAAAQSEIVFEHGEISKIIAIPIVNDLEAEKDESFAVELYDPTGGAQLGKHTKTVVTIINDDGNSNAHVSLTRERVASPSRLQNDGEQDGIARSSRHG